MNADEDVEKVVWQGRFITAKTRGKWEYVSRARGSEGGGDGAPSAARIERSDGRVDVLPARARAEWTAGDRLVIETAGGGAWGAPAHRQVTPENPTT